MKRICADIVIDAPPRKVWDIITDFDKYPEWNRFTPRITLRNAGFAEGAEFDLDCRMTDRLLLKNEHETVLTVDPAGLSLCMGTSRTRGRPGIRSFRWQICGQLDGGRSHFTNYEEFHGPLAPLVRLLYGKKLKAAFRKYCLTLKDRAESKG